MTSNRKGIAYIEIDGWLFFVVNSTDEKSVDNHLPRSDQHLIERILCDENKQITLHLSLHPMIDVPRRINRNTILPWMSA